MSEATGNEPCWEICGPARWEDVDWVTQLVTELCGGGPDRQIGDDQ